MSNRKNKAPSDLTLSSPEPTLDKAKQVMEEGEQTLGSTSGFAAYNLEIVTIILSGLSFLILKETKLCGVQFLNFRMAMRSIRFIVGCLVQSVASTYRWQYEALPSVVTSQNVTRHCHLLKNSTDPGQELLFQMIALFFFSTIVLGVECRFVYCMLGKHSTTEPQPQSVEVL